MRAAHWRLLRVGTGLLLLALVLMAVDLRSLGAALAGADLRAVVLGLVGLTAIHLVPAAAWRTMVRLVSGVTIGWPETVEISYAAQAVGGVTPANLGGDVLRAAAVRSAGHGWADAIVPIVIQRATSYLALSLLSLPALIVLAAQARLATGVVLAGVTVAVLVAAAAVLLAWAPGWVRQLARGIVPRLGSLGLDPVRRLPHRALVAAGLVGLVAGLAFHAASLLLTWLLLVAVDPTTATLPVFAALTIARLSLAVPLTPSGVGIQEAVVVTVVAAIGGPVEAVLAGLLLARLSLVATTIIGSALVAGGRARLAGPATESLPER